MLTNAQRKQLDAEICEFIREHGEATGYAVDKDVKATKGTIRAILKRLVREGTLNSRETEHAIYYSLKDVPFIAIRTSHPAMTARIAKSMDDKLSEVPIRATTTPKMVSKNPMRRS